MNTPVLPSDSENSITSAAYLSATTTASFNETFTVSDVSNHAWIFGGVGDSNQPFLTANPNPVAASGGIPGNPAVQLDTNGNGALRLTNANLYEAGFAILNQPLAANQGLEISFDFFAYGGTGADGISVVLLDGSQPLPTTSGAYGGALGYSQRDTADLPAGMPGIGGGYLGIGLDGFGNYSNPTEGRQGGPGFVPDAVAVRGSEANAYAYLTGSKVPFSIDNPGSDATREESLRKAQIKLTADGLLTVTVQADLNQDGDFTDPNETVTPIDAYDVDAVNGALPDSFRLGFAGATGADTNIHEIRNLHINPLHDDGDGGGNDGGNGDTGSGNGGNNGGNNGGGGFGGGCKPGRRIKGDRKDDHLRGGKNADQIWGRGGKDHLSGGNCGDQIEGGRGKDILYGGGKNDRLKGGRKHDRLHGNQGNDKLGGGFGNDMLSGGRGNDDLRGKRDNDDLRGKYGNDNLYGGRDRDSIAGGTNRDRLYGNQSDDILYGQKGVDVVNGGLGHDKLDGGLGKDVLDGRRGNDRLNGGAGQDTLYGGIGNDVLVGSRAADLLVGGEGDDRFVFKSIKDKRDRISDFATTDVIDLRPILTRDRYASANPFSDYVRLVQQGANTIVQVDADGDLAPDGFKTLARLDNVLVANVGVNNFLV